MRLLDLARQLDGCVLVSAGAIDQRRVEAVGVHAVGTALVERAAEALKLSAELLGVERAQPSDQPADRAHEPHVHGDRLEVAVEVGVEPEADLGTEHR